MKAKEAAGLQFFEAAFLAVLAFLPFIVVQKYISILVIGVLLSCGFYHLIKSKIRRAVKVEDKAVLITGCDTGFGNSLARRLDSMGFSVFATCLDTSSDGAAKLKESNSGRLHVIQMDITKEESVKQCVKIVQSFCHDKGLWCLVNNAGVQRFGDIEFTSMSTYKTCYETNVLGMIMMTKLCLPLIRTAKGRVINMTACQGKMALPCQSSYSLCNFGIEAFSDALRLEMRKFGVKVITIEPGNFSAVTAMLSKPSLMKLKEDFEAMWDEASDETKTAYSRDYIDTQTLNFANMASSSCQTLVPVIRTMEDAVTNRDPPRRYVIGGSNSIVADKMATMARLKSILPECVQDYLLDRMYGTSLSVK